MRGGFALGIALAAGLIGCGGGDDDETTGPIAGNCVVGSIDVGSSRTVTLGPSVGCRRPAYYESGTGSNRDQSYVAGYEVNLVGGQAYQFSADNNDGGPRGSRDLVLTLFGPGADTAETGHLAASDDEGYDASASLIFVAPTTASYVIAVGTYDDVDVGPVTLSSRACGNLGVITSTGTLNARTINASSCVGFGLVTAGPDSSRVGVVQIQFAQGETKTLTVTSTTPSFAPFFFLAGRGADTYDFLSTDPYTDSNFGGDGSQTAETTFTARQSGLYTLLVGNASLSGTSMFNVAVTPGGPTSAAVRMASRARTLSAKQR